MRIRPEEVRRVAELARLEVRDEDLEHRAVELSAVLEYVEALRRLDLAGWEPLSFASPDAPLREDRPDGRRLSAREALAMAPESDGRFFTVPPVVENVEP
ncbi:MAG TPA: Asp-tRNA(Asn)/Glu-tRNA(Gln) amidotransferase subunit GatC [Terriglobales bacterium]|nr:Asp-tRNA(Asn)/Glu-tRNA(Gln) amidotransferase subunit GatC [Terriglobales bacterium]